MDDSAQTQGSTRAPRREAGLPPAPETDATAAAPPLPEARVMLPPSRRPAPSRPPLWEQPRMLAAMLATLLALPALLFLSQTGGSPDAEALSTGAGDGSPLTSLVRWTQESLRADAEATTTTEGPTSTAAPSTTPSTAAPTTAPPTTWAAPVRQRSIQPAPTTAWTPPTTAWRPPPTTSAPPPPPPTQPAPSHSESGEASWYDYRPGECAHKTLPKGTVVTIHAVNGNTATCVVTDRGPYGPGRIIDLDRGVFAQLTSPGAGVIAVTITW